VAMEMRNGVCVCFDEQKILFWGSFIGNYYTLICQPSSTAVHFSYSFPYAHYRLDFSAISRKKTRGLNF
jgi:hypothetical protein